MSLKTPQYLGIFFGLLLLVSFTLFSLSAASANLGALVTNLEGNINDDNVSGYMLSGAIFLFVATIIFVMIFTLGADSNVTGTSKFAYIATVIALLFLCFPLTLLRDQYVLAIILASSPFIGWFVGYWLVRKLNSFMTLSRQERIQMRNYCLGTFLITMGFFQSIQ